MSGISVIAGVLLLWLGSTAMLLLCVLNINRRLSAREVEILVVRGELEAIQRQIERGQVTRQQPNTREPVTLPVRQRPAKKAPTAQRGIDTPPREELVRRRPLGPVTWPAPEAPWPEPEPESGPVAPPDVEPDFAPEVPAGPAGLAPAPESAYRDAVTLVKRGLTHTGELVARCGVSPGEAELIVRLHGRARDGVSPA